MPTTEDETRVTDDRLEMLLDENAIPPRPPMRLPPTVAVLARRVECTR
jgi:hypothetical protein